jgi:hypothetical protein
MTAGGIAPAIASPGPAVPDTSPDTAISTPTVMPAIAAFLSRRFGRFAPDEFPPRVNQALSRDS